MAFCPFSTQAKHLDLLLAKPANKHIKNGEPTGFCWLTIIAMLLYNIASYVYTVISHEYNNDALKFLLSMLSYIAIATHSPFVLQASLAIKPYK